MSLFVSKLAGARVREEQAKRVVAALRESWEAEHAFHLEELAAAKANLALMEEGVKAEALAAYQQSGDRKGIAGTEVKLYETLAYTEADAMTWAKESGMCLTLDKKGFEKVAKATALPFVTKGEEPRVSIASDLSAFIPQE